MLLLQIACSRYYYYYFFAKANCCINKSIKQVSLRKTRCPICQLIKVCAYRVHFSIQDALLHDLPILPDLRHIFRRYQIATNSDRWCRCIWYRSCGEINWKWPGKSYNFRSRKSNRWTCEYSQIWWVSFNGKFVYILRKNWPRICVRL